MTFPEGQPQEQLLINPGVLSEDAYNLDLILPYEYCTIAWRRYRRDIHDRSKPRRVLEETRSKSTRFARERSSILPRNYRIPRRYCLGPDLELVSEYDVIYGAWEEAEHYH